MKMNWKRTNGLCLNQAELHVPSTTTELHSGFSIFLFRNVFGQTFSWIPNFSKNELGICYQW